MSGTIDLGVIPVDDVFVMDINGDGLADIVAVGYNYILYWINQGNGSFSPMFTRTGMPLYQRGCHGAPAGGHQWQRLDRFHLGKLGPGGPGLPDRIL